jgi:hypothetical protein
MIQRTLDLEYDKLVIGSDLSAFSYAYANKIPLIYINLEKPYKYSENENWILETNIWEDLAFLLSYSSYIPLGDKVSSIRIEDNNILKVVTKNNLLCNIKFNFLTISDDKKIDGLPPVINKTSNDYWVIDKFKVITGSEHEYKYLNGVGDFVKKVYFYKNTRLPTNIGKNMNKKDVLCVSKIEEKNLDNFDYSHVCSRIVVTKLMKQAGIVGRRNGVNRKSRRPVQLDCDERIIYPLGRNIYNTLPNNINILYDNWDKILLQNSIEDEYINKLKINYGINI